MGWRDGSGTKSTNCSFRGPGFSSQLLHGGSQLFITPVPGDPWQNTSAQKIKNFLKKEYDTLYNYNLCISENSPK